jgi:pimeloyl-ACP methyl ester carboxylesterase
MSRLFVPGFGALPSFYRAALSGSWDVHEPPTFRESGVFDDLVAAVRRSLDAHRSPVTLGGHSMGAALAVAVALQEPQRVERLLLVGPAGLPLTKPIAVSLRDFWKQVTAGVYSSSQLARSVGRALVAPRKAYELASAVRSLDLTEQFREIRRLGLPCSVIGCAGDTLTPVEHCREIARLSGARYRELDAVGGHMWMVADPAAFAAVSD